MVFMQILMIWHFMPEQNGDFRGYKMAMEEAEDIATEMIVTSMLNK